MADRAGQPRAWQVIFFAIFGGDIGHYFEARPWLPGPRLVETSSDGENGEPIGCGF